MTSQYENDENCREPSSARLEEIARHARQIHKKIDDIASRLDGSCQLLREILEATSDQNTVGEHDLYESDNGYY